LKKLEKYSTSEEPFTLTLDDPTGNSFIENIFAPKSDPEMTAVSYTRTAEQKPTDWNPAQV